MEDRRAGKRVFIKNYTGELTAFETRCKILKITIDRRERGIVFHEGVRGQQDRDIREGEQG